MSTSTKKSWGSTHWLMGHADPRNFFQKPVTSYLNKVEMAVDLKHGLQEGAHAAALKTLSHFDSHIADDPKNPITSSLKRIGKNVSHGASMLVVMVILLGGVIWLTRGGKKDNQWYSVAGKALILVITGGIVISTWGRILNGDASVYHSAGAYFQQNVKGKLYEKIGLKDMDFMPGDIQPTQNQ